jgi:UTP--glucose-1-phosphate uridylyltransferase
MKVQTAVIPAAGLGTRFLPVTKSMPKEMLPIISKPVIHYVVEEAIRSGIEDIIIITGRGKRAIEDYFDDSPELAMYLASRKKDEMLRYLKDISQFCGIHYIRQREPRGLGDAILCAERHCGGEPFAVLLGDDIMKDTTPCIGQMIPYFEKRKDSVIAIQKIPVEKLSRYGIVKGTMAEENLMQLEDIVEKPRPEEAPSRCAAIGRYLFVPELFDCLKETTPGVGGEIQLTDAIKLLITRHPVYGYLFQGHRFDTGDKWGYIETILHYAREDPQIRPLLEEYLKNMCTDLR